MPPRGGARPDFAITAQVAAEAGLDLEGRSPALVMERIAANVKAFAGISFLKLAEVREQWPVVGRGDLYYGGTTYENKQGLGVTLALNPLSPIPSTGKRAGLRADESHWLAVPITRLYDLGVTVRTSPLLVKRIGVPGLSLNPVSAKKLGVEAGAQVALNGDRLEVRVEAGVPAGVALVPRSMGTALSEPAVVKIEKA